MHLTLKLETTKPAGSNFLQQAKFDDFIECDNNDRPHQALNMHVRPSPTSPQRVLTAACRTSIIRSTTESSL